MNWWPKSNRERDLELELRNHLDLEAEQSGLSSDEALQSAHRVFGNTARVKEDVRNSWGWSSIERLHQDLRFAFRTLWKDPAFACAAVFTLALGIGANAAMFSVVDAILFRPLPFPEPQKLVRIWGDIVRQQASLVLLREKSRAADWGAYSENTEFNLTGHGEPQRVIGSVVSANFFSVLDQSPLLGRSFQTGEDRPGSDRVILLSHNLWQREFRGDPSTIGRLITIDGVARQIVGIMPPAFRFPSVDTAFWLPVRIDPRNVGDYWWTYNLNIVGRLRSGIVPAQAQAELQSLIPAIRDSFPWRMWPDWGRKARVVSLQETLVGDIRTRLLVLFAAVGLVLLLACANVANLLLARGAVRQKEIAVRAALGARRGRIVRQLLTESVLLALLGSVTGLTMAFAIERLFWRVLPSNIADFGGHLDFRVLLFAAALGIATALLFGVVPALRISRSDVQSGLKSSDRTTTSGASRQQLSTLLMTAEIAIGVVVVIAAGLLARSFLRLVDVDPGFQKRGLLTALVTPNTSLCDAPDRCSAFYQEVLEHLRALPGVAIAAAVNPLPLSGDINGGAMELQGHPVLPGHSAPTLWGTVVTPGYLRAMSIAPLSGRGILETDHEASAAVVLVTASTAKRWWPGESPLGKHLRYIAENQWRTVVGVVPDTLDSALTGDPDWLEGHIYFPFSQSKLNSPRMNIVLKTAANPLRLIDPLRRTIAQIRPDVPVTGLRTMEEVVSNSVSTPRSTMWLLFSFAILALVLSLIGVYAIISYAVAQRIHEIGIRMALGARAEVVLLRILSKSLYVALAGLSIGVGVAFLCTRLMTSLLFGVTAHDPATFIVVPLSLLLLVLLATYIPAGRAVKSDPLAALRHE